MGYLDNSRGPAYPLILKDLNLTPAMGSWFFSLSSLAGLIVYLTAKHWLPVLGVVRGTKLSLLIMSLGTFTMGVLPELPYQYFFLLFFSMIFGIGQGLSTYCMNLLVAEASSPEVRSRAFSALHSCYGVASFVAPLVFSFFLNWQHNWSSFYLVMSILPLVVWALVFKVGRGVKHEPKEPIQSGLSFLERIPYGGVFSFYVASEIVISSRLVYFLTEGRNFSSVDASKCLSLFFLSLMAGRILFAFLPMRGKSYHAMILSLVLTIVTFFLGYYLSPWVLGLLGGTMSFYFPMGMDWLTSNFEKGREQMIGSTMTQVGFLLIIMHVFFGKLASVVGVEKALLMCPFLTSISLVFLLVLGKRKTSDDQPLRPL